MDLRQYYSSRSLAERTAEQDTTTLLNEMGTDAVAGMEIRYRYHAHARVKVIAQIVCSMLFSSGFYASTRIWKSGKSTIVYYNIERMNEEERQRVLEDIGESEDEGDKIEAAAARRRIVEQNGGIPSQD